jgi:uncharacterized membrane protein YkoI
MQGFLAVLGVASSLMASAAASGQPAAGPCLSPGDASEEVATRRVVAPGQALVLARRAVPNADVLRAALCREPETLVYRITVLRPDGRLVRVTVDAPSGKVMSVH